MKNKKEAFFSDTALAKISAASKANWSSPEFRAKVKATLAARGPRLRPPTEQEVEAWEAANGEPWPLTSKKRRVCIRVSTGEPGRLSASLKGREAHNKGKPAWNRGISITEATREKLAAAGRGRKHSEATKKKMSRSMTGLKRSKESRIRMSRAAALRAAAREGDPSYPSAIKSFCKDWQGNIIKLASDCERAYFLVRQSEGVKVRAYDPALDGEYKYLFGDTWRIYIPDFVEEREDGTKVVTEVKAVDDTDLKNAHWHAKANNKAKAKAKAFPEVLIVNGLRMKPRARRLPDWDRRSAEDWQ